MSRIPSTYLIFFRILLILSASAGSLLLFGQELVYTGLFVVLIAVLLVWELLWFVKNTFTFYEKTIDAILNNDFSADFSKRAASENYKSLFKLYNRLRDNQHEEVSKDLVYRSILNNIESGVLILQKEQNEWNIFLMNDYFSRHFMVPKVSRWHYLKAQLPSLCDIIEAQEFNEIKTALQIQVRHQDTQTFILQTSRTTTHDHEYYIILLDSIQKVIEKKEKEAWINLMKVISHELMNSLTPIRSLTQNLNDLMRQEALSKDDLEDIRQSASAMMSRSDHLQNFVESYRKLAMLPTPEKAKIEISALIADTLRIMEPMFKKAQIEVRNSIAFNRHVYADKLQLEQVLINLFTNSMYAVENRDTKIIEIALEAKNNRIFLLISDTGTGIEKEIEDKIFLPFFTTRKDGAGIGLTLSKNIVEAHGGYLSCQIEEQHTKFVICLIE